MKLLLLTTFQHARKYFLVYFVLKIVIFCPQLHYNSRFVIVDFYRKFFLFKSASSKVYYWHLSNLRKSLINGINLAIFVETTSFLIFIALISYFDLQTLFWLAFTERALLKMFLYCSIFNIRWVFCKICFISIIFLQTVCQKPTCKMEE